MTHELRQPTYKSPAHVGRLLRESSLCEWTAATLAELMLKNSDARPPVGLPVETSESASIDDEECPGR